MASSTGKVKSGATDPIVTSALLRRKPISPAPECDTADASTRLYGAIEQGGWKQLHTGSVSLDS